jgi:predicted DCC family thiol-disulfide oxidoreductase YuxK
MSTQTDTDDAPRLTTLYHGDCPVCGSEVAHYQRHAQTKALALGWEDISNDTAAPLMHAHGLDRESAKRRLHVVTAEGDLLVGVDAFLALWREMPRYRWIAKFVGIPGIRHLAIGIYEGLLAPGLYALNRWRGR